MSYLFTFTYCSCFQGKNAEVVRHALLQWTTFCQHSLHMTLPLWVALHGMVHNFLELDKIVTHVISLLVFVILLFILFTL